MNAVSRQWFKASRSVRRRGRSAGRSVRRRWEQGRGLRRLGRRTEYEMERWTHQAGREMRQWPRQLQRELHRLPARAREGPRSSVRTIRHDVRHGNFRGLALLFLVMGFALLPLQNVRLTAELAFADLFLVAAGIVAVISRHHLPMRNPVPVRLRNGIALMAVGGGLALLFADDRAVSSRLLLQLFVVMAVAFVAVLRIAPTGREVNRLLVAFVVAGGFSGFVSAVGDVTGAPFLERSTFGGRAIGLTISRLPVVDVIRGTNTTASLATNPNLFGGVSAIAAAIAIILLIEATSARWRLVYAVSAAGLTLGVLFSGSRSSLLALLVGCAPVIWRLVSRGYGRQVVGGAAVIGLLVVISLFSTVRAPSLDRLLLRTDSASSERTAESTILRYQNATRGVEGRGWSSLAVGSGLRDDSAAKLHDGHLEIWIGLGFLGLAGWVLVCVGVIEPGVSHARRRGTLAPREVALLAVGGGFAAHVAVTLFVDTVWNRYIWLLVALALTLALRPDGNTPAVDDGDGHPPDPVVEPPARVLATAGV